MVVVAANDDGLEDDASGLFVFAAAAPSVAGVAGGFLVVPARRKAEGMVFG